MANKMAAKYRWGQPSPPEATFEQIPGAEGLMRVQCIFVGASNCSVIATQTWTDVPERPYN
jgi:hypothetical protein